METQHFERNFHISLTDRFLMAKIDSTAEGETEIEALQKAHDKTIAKYIHLYPHMKDFLYEEEPNLRPKPSFVDKVSYKGMPDRKGTLNDVRIEPVIQVSKAQEANLLDNYTSQIQEAKTLNELEGYDAILQKYPALEIVWKEKYIQLQNS